MKVLSIGNSFGLDTMYHLPGVCKDLGVSDFTFAILYIGGCSINRHYHNLLNSLAEYKYYKNTGLGWSIVEGKSIQEALAEEDWDIISIQHGTGDGSRYTSLESYENLVPLVKNVKGIYGKPVKIAFNMAWVADPDCPRREIMSYGGNQILMYEKLTELTRDQIATLKEIDVVSPTGTAIQNARSVIERPLTRDGFHLSFDLGRYIASLTFGKVLLGLDIEKVEWIPEGVLEREREVAKAAALAAVKEPYVATKLESKEN